MRIKKEFIQKSNDLFNEWKVRKIIEKLLYEKGSIEKRAQSTLHFYKQNLKSLRGISAHPVLRKITALQLQEFINGFISTSRKCKALYQCLSGLFNHMERLDLIEQTPVTKVICPD